MDYIESIDGTKIAYYDYGKGTPIFIFNGFACSEISIKKIVDTLSTKYRVIFYDYKGHGKSESPKDFKHVTVNDAVDDAKKVLDKLKIKEACLVGYSTGVQVMFEFHGRYATFAKSLVCISGFSERVLDSFLNTKVFNYIAPAIKKLAQKFPKPFTVGWKGIHNLPFKLRLFVASKVFLNEDKTIKAEVQPFLDSLAELDIHLLLHFIDDVNKHKLTKPISEITLPTLVMCGEKDLFAPIGRSMEIHSAISDSEFLAIPNASHNVVQEEPELLANEILKFISKKGIK